MKSTLALTPTLSPRKREQPSPISGFADDVPANGSFTAPACSPTNHRHAILRRQCHPGWRFSGGPKIVRSNSSGVFIGGGSANEAGPNANDVTLAGGFGNSGGGWLNKIRVTADQNVIGGGNATVLQKLARIPISEWSYIGYDQRHIGPMAQDFHAQFPLNANDKALNDADLHGVRWRPFKGSITKSKQGSPRFNL